MDTDTVELVIIGSGPAGLSCAIYTARGNVDTLLLGCKPKIAGNYDIDNYFGFAETISGEELMARGLKQAARFGAEATCEKVLSIYYEEDGRFKIKTAERYVIAHAVVIATGVSRVKPGIDNLDDYDGKGVSYCVSCDGFFYRNQPVMVVGEKIFAANQALELTQYTPHVSICTQGKPVDMTDDFLARLKEANIPVIEQKIDTLEGAPGLERVVFADGSTQETHGLFIALGEAGSSDFAYTLGLERDGEFIKVDRHMHTNIPGIYAAGDCIGGFLQIAVAVGEGAMAAREAISFVRKRRRALAEGTHDVTGVEASES